MPRCNHDIGEQETAVAWDGLCPLCLAAEVEQTREALKTLWVAFQDDDAFRRVYAALNIHERSE